MRFHSLPVSLNNKSFAPFTPVSAAARHRFLITKEHSPLWLQRSLFNQFLIDGPFCGFSDFFFPNRQCSRDHSSTDLAPPLSSSFLVLRRPSASQISLTFHGLVPADKMHPPGLSDRLAPFLLPRRLFLQPPCHSQGHLVLRDSPTHNHC